MLGALRPTLMDLRKGSCNCLLVERLACFGTGIFILDELNGVSREEGRRLVRIVDGVNMAIPLPGRDHLSVALEMVLSEEHPVLNATGWEPSFKGVLRWFDLFLASPQAVRALGEFGGF